MTLTIDLNPDEEARLAKAAAREGLDPAVLAKRLVTERLPTINGVTISDNNGVNLGVNVDDNGDDNGAASPADRVRALLAKWQAQDNTPLVAAGPEPLPGETPTQALFRTWDEEDARMSDEEREAEDRLWEEIENGLAENRGLPLRRAGA